MTQDLMWEGRPDLLREGCLSQKTRNFSIFPVGEPNTPKGYKPSNEQHDLPKGDDPLQHEDPWKNFKSTSGPTGFPTSFRDNLFAEPRQRAASPDPGMPHANASGGSADTGNSAESLLRELISAIGIVAPAEHPMDQRSRKQRLCVSPSFPLQRSIDPGELQSAKKFTRRLIDQMMPGHGGWRYMRSARIRRITWLN